MVFPKDWNMNTLTKLTLLSLALSATACNEKVSPELQGAAASSTTTGGSSTTVTPDEYYFRVTNTASALLNFKLHKTGTGNANKNCEITSSLALSSDLYRTNPAYDISCYFEAEEMALNLNGLSFAVESSANTCAYVGYSPFSYYNFQPGSSTQTIHNLKCEGTATTAEALGQVPALNAAQTCDTYRSQAAGVIDNIIPESEGVFCNFDYSSIPGFPEGSPNCDEGTLNIIDYTVNGIDNDDDGVSDTFEVTSAPRTVKCGGKALNCIQGAITQVDSLAKFTSGTEVTQAELNVAFSKEYTLPKLFGEYGTNRRWSNYRRDLASTEIEYGNSDRFRNDGDSSTLATLSSSYMSAFGDPLFKNDYDPNLMLMYSNNKRMDGTTLVTSAMRTAQGMNFMRNVYSGYTFTYGQAFAAEPFLGFTGYKTNPFYTFYCFDNALDIRARIRMVVRDWDRVLPASATDSYLERISDVDQLPPIARQDVPYTEEITGDPDSWNDFNDIYDWDDLLDMERDDSGIPYDPSTTIWRPYPVAPFTDGHLNPYIFPMEVPEQ